MRPPEEPLGPLPLDTFGLLGSAAEALDPTFVAIEEHFAADDAANWLAELTRHAHEGDAAAMALARALELAERKIEQPSTALPVAERARMIELWTLLEESGHQPHAGRAGMALA